MANTTVEKVFLRHPHTKDEVEVDALHASLVPYMVRGYQQFTPAPAPKAQPAITPATPASIPTPGKE
jgi:hypothetical protein